MKKKASKKNRITAILLVAVLLAGLSLLLYPTVSDYWNSFHQTRAIAAYTDEVENLDDESYEKMLEEAHAYNNTLTNSNNRFILTEEEEETYESLLDITGTGIMGYIEIPSIRCSLPIYHGTDDAVLQIAAGHVPGSSLPVGGENTHCVLSGHRGLPSAKLFTDLDELTVGDIFVLHVLDEVLTYEVDQIHIVEPEDLDLLGIEEGQDLCTLVTCTPYGINTHRLLVRGHRIENLESASSARVPADAVQVDPVMVAPVVAAPVLLIVLVWVLVSSSKKKQGNKKK